MPDNDWIRERQRERDILQREQYVSPAETESLWRGLCRALKESTLAYEEGVPADKIDWSVPLTSERQARIVLGTRTPGTVDCMVKQRNQLDLKLDRKTAEVRFRYAKPCEGRVEGRIRIGPDGKGGATFLDDSGAAIKPSDAARLILEPFLFGSREE